MEMDNTNNSVQNAESVQNTESVQNAGAMQKPIETNIPDVTAEIPVDQIAFLAGGANEVRVIMNDVKKRDEKLSALNSLLSQKKLLENEIKQQKAKLDNDISAEIKKGVVDATAEEDKILSEQRTKLKETKTNRERAKTKGMKERIETETQSFVEENTSKHREIRKMLSDNGLPGYCDSNWFFTMYAPDGLIQGLIRIAVFILGLLAVPSIILLIADPWWLWKVIWWAVIDAVFILVYVTIYLFTKDKDNGTIEDVRQIRYVINDNNKKIVEIKKNIRNDKDESVYNLGEFDDEINKVQYTIDATSSQREAKLKEFEEVTKPQIIARITNECMPVIEEKQKNANQCETDCSTLTAELNEMNKNIADNYEKYLTPKYTNIQQLNIILQIIESKQAVNIGKALELMKK